MEVISARIDKVSLAPDGEFLRGSFPSQAGPVKLYLDFKSHKTDEALRGMDNLYLWYNLKALAPLRSAEGTPSPVSSAVEVGTRAGP